jgi:hypothetical protein
LTAQTFPFLTRNGRLERGAFYDFGFRARELVIAVNGTVVVDQDRDSQAQDISLEPSGE